MTAVLERQRLPEWLRRSLPVSSSEKTHAILSRYELNTVCESAKCPNRSECYSRDTATFMILGNVCTRSCGFCAIETGKGQSVEDDEPQRVAEAAKELGLKYVVVTAVARDDLADEGAAHFARTVEALKREIPGVRVEVLTPDFHAREDLIARVLSASPDVYNHNIETVRRLQREVRVQASYDRSLRVIETVKRKNPMMMTKSGLMLGLGEMPDEIYRTAFDLRTAGCDILTLGQYLAPSDSHLKIKEFVEPSVFAELGRELKKLGFAEVFSGPYVRSSYHAGETFLNAV